MSSDTPSPDYDMEEVRVVSSPKELRALGHRIRDTILDLVLERAASVSDLAAAIGRPPSTVAYHVNVLVDAGMLKVVRTRRVRAVEERFYGRTAGIFYIGAIEPEQAAGLANLLAVAASDSAPAHRADDLRSVLRRARIPRESVVEFWERVFELTNEFSRIPRGGDTVYAFVAGLYPTEYPTLPDRHDKD